MAPGWPLHCKLSTLTSVSKAVGRGGGGGRSGSPGPASEPQAHRPWKPRPSLEHRFRVKTLFATWGLPVSAYLSYVKTNQHLRKQWLLWWCTVLKIETSLVYTENAGQPKLHRNPVHTHTPALPPSNKNPGACLAPGTEKPLTMGRNQHPQALSSLFKWPLPTALWNIYLP